MRRGFATSGLHLAEDSRLPRVADPSLWRSLVPKALRREEGGSLRTWWQKRREKKWNPATIFIILSISVGSFAINILALRREMLNFSRRTDAKLGLLREVLGRVKNGEDVDVERLLGTGDPRKEQEWEEVMQELESTDMLAEGQEKRAAKKARQAEKRAAAKEEMEKEKAEKAAAEAEKGDGGDTTTRRPKFMM